MMATADGGNSAVVDALALGQIERASLLLSEGSSLDLQRAAEVVIDKGQYEALEFLLSNYKLDVDKHFLLHRALVLQQENIAKLLVKSGANVNNHHSRFYEGGSGHYSCYLPLQLSLFCSLHMTRFLLDFGADVNKKNNSREATLVFPHRVPVAAARVLENEANVNAEYRHDVTSLHWATRLGDTEILTLLIDHGADIEAEDSFGCTPLKWACRNSEDVVCLKILLEKGADCDAKNFKTYETALHLAVKSGNSMALKLLIQYGAQLEARTLTGDTALILACGESVPAECVRILLENGAFPNVKNTKMKTPLILAKEIKKKEKIQMLLQYGATEEDRLDQEKTYFLRACGKPGIVRFDLRLLQVSPNVKNHRGKTALHITADRGDIKTLKALVQCKADVNAMTDLDETPLMLACEKSSVSVECIKFLLENRALPNLTDRNGDTALLRAVKILVQFGTEVNMMSARDLTWHKRRATEVIKLLVKHGADLKARTLRRESPLFTAVKSGQLQLIDFLYDLGADVCAKDERGQNALMVAIETATWGYDESHVLLHYLIDKGVSVNHRDKNGWTPLMLAAKDGQVEMLKLLIKAGANVHAVRTEKIEHTGEKIIQKITALSIALAEGPEWERSGCVEELIRHGAMNSLPEQILHRLILLDKRKNIQFLLTNGIAPTMSDSVYLYRFRSIGPVSPLTLALYCGNISVIQFLLGNLMLCPSDIYGHSYFRQWRDWNMPDVVTMMDEFYSQPKSLFQLSFVIVSHALGGVPGRVDRVNSLPLPPKVKDKLLFKSIDVPMDLLAKNIIGIGDMLGILMY